MKFDRNKFRFDGMYLHYEGKFVARFKYARAVRCAASFRSFLIANFTPAEYFAAREAGQAPGPILEAKGWIHPNLKRARARMAA